MTDGNCFPFATQRKLTVDLKFTVFLVLFEHTIFYHKSIENITIYGILCNTVFYSAPANKVSLNKRDD